MSQKVVAQFALFIGAVFLVGTFWDFDRCFIWLSLMVFPMALTTFYGTFQAVLILSVAGVIASLMCLTLGSVEWYLLSGPVTLLSAAGFLLVLRDRDFQNRMLILEDKRSAFSERMTFLKQQSKRYKEIIRKQESSIHEISELYGVSKQFLATLSSDEALQMTDESLSRWLPDLPDSERKEFMESVATSLQDGDVSIETLFTHIPLANMDTKTRERWGMVCAQVALGLQRVSLYSRVQNSATHDGLTGLLVRRMFLQRLDEEMERSKRKGLSVAFMMIDLDHFKQINDRFGHLVGDVVLRTAAERIRSSVREMDLVSRYGGEEFAVALPEADMALAEQIAERIRFSIERTPVSAYDERVSMTVSIGLALCPEHTTSVTDLIESADQAMYRAKRNGRNCTVVTDKDEQTSP